MERVTKPDTGHIGVFDSGVGGLTVVRALRKTLPHCSITYLGDTARVPYGAKSPRTVERYSLACQRFLLERHVELVMVACNTASANALTALEVESPVPVIGAVGPGAQSAVRASSRGRIGVIGTLATVASGAYEQAISRLAPEAQVETLACPLFVPLAEEGWTDDDIARAVARRYLRALFAREPQLDTLVLGCTHYPLLRGVVSEVAAELSAQHAAPGQPGPGIQVVDSASAMADAARSALLELGIAERHSDPERAPGELRVFATDTSRLDQVGPRFLGEPIEKFALVDL